MSAQKRKVNKSRYVQKWGSLSGPLDHIFPNKVSMLLLSVGAIAIVPNVSIYSFFYYAAIVGLILIWLRWVRRVYQSTGQEGLSIGGALWAMISPIGAWNYYYSFLDSFADYHFMPLGENGVRYIRNSAFGTTIRTSIFLHILLFSVCAVDFFNPLLAQDIYDYFRGTIVYIHRDWSDSAYQMMKDLSAHGYESRIDFLTFTYSIAMFISVSGFIYTLMDIRKVFSTEQKYTIKLFSTTNISTLKTSPNTGLYLCAVGPFFTIFLIYVFSTSAHPILLDDTWHLFASNAHIARLDVLWLGVLGPLAMVWGPWLVIRCVSAVLYLAIRKTVRLIRNVIRAYKR